MSVRRKTFRTLRRPGVPLNSEGCVDWTVAIKIGRAAGARHIKCHTREPHLGYIIRVCTEYDLGDRDPTRLVANEQRVNNQQS
jgi:hypothetical protein